MMTSTADKAIEAAKRHSDETGMVENEVAALHTLLRSALSMMSPKAREVWAAKLPVAKILAFRAPDDAPNGGTR